MNINCIIPANIFAHLANCLKKWQTLNIADCTTNFNYDNICS